MRTNVNVDNLAARARARAAAAVVEDAKAQASIALDALAATIDIRVCFDSEHVDAIHFDNSGCESILAWVEAYPVGHKCESGWVLYTDDEDNNSNDEWFIGGDLLDVDYAIKSAQQWIAIGIAGGQA